MFTKKIEDQFSADLLNTVQSVLDEAKKCKDCDCAKCECEDAELHEATAHERVQSHPAVQSVDNGGKGDYFVNLKKGYHYSGQRAFGNDSAAAALKVLKHVKAGSVDEEFELEEAKGAGGSKPVDIGEKEYNELAKKHAGAKYNGNYSNGIHVHKTNDGKIWSQTHSHTSHGIPAIQRSGNQYQKFVKGVNEDVDHSDYNGVYQYQNKRGYYVNAHVKHAGGGKFNIRWADGSEGKHTHEQLRKHIQSGTLAWHKPLKEDVEFELEESKMKDLISKHMDAGHDYDTALSKAKKHLDVPFDGPYRKPGTRKDQYGNVVKNVAKHLARKAMAKEEIDPDLEDELKATRQTKKSVADAKKKYGMKEDSEHTNCGTPECCGQCDTAEQIDELSKKTLGSYVKKASASQFDWGSKGNLRQGLRRDRGITKAVDKITKEEAEQIDELSKGTMGRYINKAADRMSTQGVTAGLKIAADEKSSKNFKTIAKRQKGVATAVSKLTKEEQDFIDSLNDVDQIDELSGATLGSYVAKSRKDETDRRGAGIKTRDEIRKQIGLRVGARIDRKLYSPTLANRGAGQKVAVKKLTGQARVNAKEEVELEEGRGRPPKEGSAAWKARQNQANDDMTALGVQLRKAKSMNKKVRFMNGKEHEVHPNHVDRFEDHMAARKTSQDKGEFQKHAHKSHEDFVKAVTAPVPKVSKDTGEIVKYRH